MGTDGQRYCPLHGDYAVSDQETACPECRANPEQSTVSLQRVRLLSTGDVSTIVDGDSHLTDIHDELPCPVCGLQTSLGDFRHEAIGEVWTREAAEWAEEGVCPGCYRDILPPYIREWSDGEWLSHHYEGWRNTVESVGVILRYQDSAQETWRLPEDRHQLLDIEATLSARREHLALCQSAMEDLRALYPSSMTPPPFDQTLGHARDQSLSEAAVRALRKIRNEDQALEDELREDSIHAFHDVGAVNGVTQLSAVGAGVETIPEQDAATGEEAEAESQRWPLLAAALLVLAVLVWLLSRN